MNTDKSRKLLVVEDDEGLQKQYRWSLSDFQPVIVSDRVSAVAAVDDFAPPVVTLDLGLPPDPANASEGLAAMGEILSRQPNTKIIVITGNDDRDNAIRAISEGAYDFYQKPIDTQVLSLMIERAYKLYELEEENRKLHDRKKHEPLPGVMASSPAMLTVCRTIEKIAPSDVSVLLLGESGTGKEILARALHGLSQRKDNPFVAINCAAIPENLLESELFGYEKGAFTGATSQTKGKIEYANGGTLLLDEVGDLPLPLQAKLLRFLQERVIERIGGRSEIAVDIRVICATHRDLKALIQSGDFREDLYYRIAEISVDIPPLRERGIDSVLIARSIINDHNEQNARSRKRLSQETEQFIESYSWDGNVRELENRIRRGLIMANDRYIQPEDLDFEPDEETAVKQLSLNEARDAAELKILTETLTRSDWNIGRAAKLLQVSRATIYNLMNKYGIKSGVKGE